MMKIKIKDNAASIYWAPKCNEQYVPSEHERKYRDMLELVQGKELEVETEYLFCDQYNTVPIEGVAENGMRIMEESVEYVIDDIRDFVGVCGYCGNQTRDKTEGICRKCLDSAYLDENTIRKGLTRIVPVGTKRISGQREPLSDEEWEYIRPKYIERQTQGADSRNAQKLKKQRGKIQAKYERKIDEIETEYEGMLWLMDSGINVDNVIYYSHTGVFCFGWRQPLSQDVRSELTKQLQDCDFPFSYEFK